MNRLVAAALFVSTGSSIGWSQTPGAYEFCNAGAETARFFISKRQQGVSLSNALEDEKAIIERHAAEDNLDRAMVDTVWRSNMNDLLWVYEYPIGSTDEEKNRIIVEYENARLSECLRNLNQ